MNPKSQDDNLVRPGLWAQRQQIPEIKEKLHAKVPKASGYDISPGVFHEVVIKYLYQNGYEKTAVFIEDLLEEEEMWMRTQNILPELRTKKNLLSRIADTLKDIEAGEATAFDLIILAKSLKIEMKTYGWISICLFDYAIELTSGIRVDGGYLEAKVRYAYAEFLLEIGKYEKATDILAVAYELAFEKTWYSMTPGRTLYNDISFLLFQGYMKTAELLRSKDIKAAIMLSKKAIKHALEAEYKYAPAKAYTIRGNLEMDNGDYKNALEYFNKAYQYAQFARMPADICDANLMRGLCMHEIGQSNRGITCIRRALRSALEHNLSFYIGQACMLMGYINETNNNFDVAGSNYVQAFQEFTLARDDFRAAKAKCHSGYAIAQVIFDSYYELLEKVTRTDDNTYLMTLVLWKEKRCPFWDEENRRYDILVLKDGYTDEYKVDEFMLKDGELTFWSQLKNSSSPWRAPVPIPYSKRLVAHFAHFMRLSYLFV